MSKLLLPDEFVRYRCNNCSAEHETEECALECCPNEITELFTCPICKARYYAEDQAIDCCGWTGEEEIEYRPTAEQLEAAGQMRLFA